MFAQNEKFIFLLKIFVMVRTGWSDQDLIQVSVVARTDIYFLYLMFSVLCDV